MFIMGSQKKTARSPRACRLAASYHQSPVVVVVLVLHGLFQVEGRWEFPRSLTGHEPRCWGGGGVRGNTTLIS